MVLAQAERAHCSPMLSTPAWADPSGTCCRSSDTTGETVLVPLVPGPMDRWTGRCKGGVVRETNRWP